MGQRRPSQIPDTVPLDDLHRRGRDARDRPPAAAVARPAGQHRHPARIRARLRRRVDSPEEASRSRPPVPHALGPVRPDCGSRVLSGTDGDPPAGHVASVDRVAADWIHHLLWIQPQAQPPAARAAGRGWVTSTGHGWHERPTAALDRSAAAAPVENTPKGARSAPGKRIIIPEMTSNGVPVPPNRAEAARDVAKALTSASHVVLTTHVNADGDGVGSEIGLWHLLRARGVSVTIANPTEIPERFHFLIPDGADASDHAVHEIERADIVASLDIGDLSRLGNLAAVINKRQPPLVCIDHHVGPVKLPSGPCLIAPEATATAELIFDLASVAGWPLTPEVAQALYVGLLTDTGGFRFSNTTARALRVAAALLEKGVDPESIYASVYASAPEGRVRLLAEVLQTLVVEPDVGLAWVSVPADALRRHEVTADDLDGIVEFPRSIAGVDVAALANQFGGGGHHRAAGASLPGTMAEVEEKVLRAARVFLANGRSA